MKLKNIGYKDRRANAPFVVCGDRFGYKDRRANAPIVVCGDRIGYKDHRANAPFVIWLGSHFLQRSQG